MNNSLTKISIFLGLSHYSKNLTDPEPRKRIVEDVETNQTTWITTKDSTITRLYAAEKFSNISEYLWAFIEDVREKFGS